MRASGHWGFCLGAHSQTYPRIRISLGLPPLFILFNAFGQPHVQNLWLCQGFGKEDIKTMDFKKSMAKNEIRHDKCWNAYYNKVNVLHEFKTIRRMNHSVGRYTIIKRSSWFSDDKRYLSSDGPTSHTYRHMDRLNIFWLNDSHFVYDSCLYLNTYVLYLDV